MKLSRASHYAVIALVHLARHGSQPVASHDIARAETVPERFLLRVLRPLARAGVLFSLKGPTGGYRLARPATSITLLNVIEVVDGPIVRSALDDRYLAGSVARRLHAVLDRTVASVRRCLAQVTIGKLAK